MVRPYVRTEGRVRADPDVRLETVVLAASGPREGLGADARRVMGLFAHSRGGGLAVADIAAALEFPPSTVRILVSSLIDDGLLTRPVAADDDRPQTDLLQEVLRGLRALV
ncbi:hypothetical protein A7J05_33670 [Streptomyces alfalfae]|uniref:DUF742 domain-containing protein n=1 Tax=Streptomyces alfalfae TaxID=1642299 RepID=A0ABN4VVT6_9ACTN|nr:hypothetical protein A7J05_33670 [Streptomyces alfalfae]KUL64235.1 hypothetical protein ADL30_01140 [Streptomyces sp. NRRL S-1521]